MKVVLAYVAGALTFPLVLFALAMCVDEERWNPW